ncbi:zincin [Clavulina sp. PMI_390]|nr:zincin [Clavulina sp. PMI_390]
MSNQYRPLAFAEMAQLASNFPPQPVSSKSKDPMVEPWDELYLSGPASPLTLYSYSRTSNITLGAALQAVSDLFCCLFGLRFRVMSASPGETWHPDVLKLEFFSEEHGGTIGWMFADLYDRAGKRSDSTHFTIRCSRRLDWDDWAGDVLYDADASRLDGIPLDHESVVNMGTTMLPRLLRGKEGLRQLPVSALSCSFSKSTLSNGASRLAWGEVKTLFHEMGHAVHAMIGQTEYHAIAGTRCARDFMEFPSTLMERFLASPKIHPLLNVNERSKSSPTVEGYRNISSAIIEHHYVILSMIDQAYHSHLASSPSFSSTSTFFDIYRTHAAIPRAPKTAEQMQHPQFYTYQATYYTYPFGEAIASRVFDKVFADDPLNRESGQRYMDEVLGHGGGKNPWLMVGELLGDEEIMVGDGKAMGRVGKWAVDAFISASQQHISANFHPSQPIMLANAKGNKRPAS